MSSLAASENLADSMWALLPVPGPGKLKGLGRLGELAVDAVKTGDKVKRFLVVAKDGTQITGYTTHGLHRAIGDGGKRAGTSPSAILDALRNPTKIVSKVDDIGRPSKVFTGRYARVVVNPNTGKIVSVNPMSKRGVR